MKVHIRQIPPEGLHLEGAEDSKILDLREPNITALGPVNYSLDVGLSGDGLFATGTLTVDLRLECVSCLEKMEYPVRVDDFAVQIELDGRETVDLTPQVREDILLNFPPYPHCDWNGEKVCKGVQRPNASETEASPL